MQPHTSSVRIDAMNLHYTDLNKKIREAVSHGALEVEIDNVLGQRFIADGLRGEAIIRIHGTVGGDLGMFMNGPTCIVYGNCDHAPGNTMGKGTIVIHGSAGDAVAHSMRGGRIFVRGDIGYRGGIHMKQYGDTFPILVVGGSARAFTGEYMAGGMIVVLGLGSSCAIDERGIGTGIHGGEIVIRGHVDERNLGLGAKMHPCEKEEMERVVPLVQEYSRNFGGKPDDILACEFTRITPASTRPFANKYTWE